MKQRVLVVDDDRLVADTLSMVFAANGYESQARYSAAEGLECARSFEPGLMLCDVSMPYENGLELAEKIRVELPGCKLLLLTAYSSNESKVATESEKLKRPLRLLNKPCRPEELLHEVGELLRRA